MTMLCSVCVEPQICSYATGSISDNLVFFSSLWNCAESDNDVVRLSAPPPKKNALSEADAV